MKFLITGAAGFVGRNLVDLLVRDGSHEIVATDKVDPAGFSDSMKQVKFLRADICNREQLESIFQSAQPEIVLHLAAESHVDKSIESPNVFIESNVTGTFQLLETARRYLNKNSSKLSTFRFHHVSTDEVYGSLGPDDLPFTESSSYNPRSPYSASKAASDHLVRSWFHTFEIPITVSSSSNNYGPWQLPEKLIPAVILNAINGNRIQVYGNGQNVRDWIHVSDHASAIVEVATKGIAGETYNVGASNELMNIQVVKQICHVLDELLPPQFKHIKIQNYAELIEFVEDRPGHDKRYALNTCKIKNCLGWEPAKDFQQGLRQTVMWYLENEEWWQAILQGGFTLRRQGLIRK